MEVLARAQPKDREEIAALLTRAGLAHEDVPAVGHVVVARHGGRIVGVIGLEVHGRDGLVRSLAVAPDHRGRGLARRLYASLLAEAGRLGLARLFVLPPRAVAWFALLGYRAIASDAVPEALRDSPGFRAMSDRGGRPLFRPMPRA